MLLTLVGHKRRVGTKEKADTSTKYSDEIFKTQLSRTDIFQRQPAAVSAVNVICSGVIM